MLYRHCFSALFEEGSGNPAWLEIKWYTHQLLVYADNVNILGGSVHTIQENVEFLVEASKEIELKVNVDETKYMIMSRYQNSGQCHGKKIGSISFERMVEFKYL